jgi:hypothetical protein
MLRWNAERDEKVDSERVDAYVEELIAVGRKYGVSLYHARPYGEAKGFFIIGPLSEDAEEELRKAQLHTEDV